MFPMLDVFIHEEKVNSNSCMRTPPAEFFCLNYKKSSVGIKHGEEPLFYISSTFMKSI